MAIVIVYDVLGDSWRGLLMTSIAFCFLFLRFEFLGRAFLAQEKKLFKLYMCIYIKLLCIIGTLGDSQLHNSSWHFQTSFPLFYISSIFFCIYFQPLHIGAPPIFLISLFRSLACGVYLVIAFPHPHPSRGPYSAPSSYSYSRLYPHI